MRRITVFMLTTLLGASSALVRPSLADYWPKVRPRIPIDINEVRMYPQDDFLQFYGGWDGEGQMAVWRYKGRDLVGYTFYGCGPGCRTHELHFYDPAQNWRDVTNLVLPNVNTPAIQKAMKKRAKDPAHLTVVYDFPREGTTIRLGEGDNVGMPCCRNTVGLLVFDGQTGRFHFQPVNP